MHTHTQTQTYSHSHSHRQRRITETHTDKEGERTGVQQQNIISTNHKEKQKMAVRDEACVNRLFKAVIAGTAVGAAAGTVAATWQDIPKVSIGT